MKRLTVLPKVLKTSSFSSFLFSLFSFLFILTYYGEEVNCTGCHDYLKVNDYDILLLIVSIFLIEKNTLLKIVVRLLVAM